MHGPTYRKVARVTLRHLARRILPPGWGAGASEPATLAAVSAVGAVGGHRERSVGARRRGHPPCSGEGWRRGTGGAVAGDGRVGGPASRRPGAGRGDPRYGREGRGDPDR